MAAPNVRYDRQQDAEAGEVERRLLSESDETISSSKPAAPCAPEAAVSQATRDAPLYPTKAVTPVLVVAQRLVDGTPRYLLPQGSDRLSGTVATSAHLKLFESTKISGQKNGSFFGENPTFDRKWAKLG